VTRLIHGVEVQGVNVDAETRCGHWHSALDVIAIKFKCCGEWYPCFACHAETAGHAAEFWPQSEFSQKAILCGACGHQLTIDEYLASDSTCTRCKVPFNPGCAKHYHLYFETGGVV
jgi:uncharacterized CHY-type Zn-finger protein